MPWHKIAPSPEAIPFNPDGLAEISVDGRLICIAKKDASLKACTHKCPHAGGRLADGYLDALGNIVCPVHRYKFNLDTGRNSSGEGFFLKTFDLEVREDGVYVEIR